MKLRIEVVLIALASIVLAGATFADWYRITATATSNGVFDFRWASPAGDGTFFQASVSPWQTNTPLAIALVAMALVSIVFAILVELEKIRPRTGSLVVTCAALGAVGLVIAQLASDHTAQAFQLTVTRHLLTGFYVAAAAAAALLVAAAGHVARRATAE